MHSARIAIAAALCLAPIGITLGCSDDEHEHRHPVAVERREPDVVLVEPGYYYDREYYDNGGAYHAPVYYHYDGHRWDRIDAVPRGYQIRERPNAVRADHDRDRSPDFYRDRGQAYDPDRR